MKVSVIIPVYNAAEWIERCLDSILSQTHQDLEICLVDDFSTDNTVEIVQERMLADERIKLEQNAENLGCGLTRRKAIAMGTGDVFAFVDADDYIDPTMLEDMLQAMADENAEIAICGTFMHKNGKYIGQQIAMKRYTTSKEELYRQYLDGLWIMQYNGNKIYSRRVIEAVEYSDLRFCEDSVTTFQWLWEAEKAVVLPRSYYHYWQHDESNSTTKNDELTKALCTVKCCDIHFDFCVEQQFLDMLPRIVNFAYQSLTTCICEYEIESDEYKYIDETRTKMLNCDKYK